MRDSQETLQPSDRRPWRCSPEEDIEIDFLSDSSLIFQNMTNENTTKSINTGLLMNCTNIEGHGRREYHPRSKCGCWSFWVRFWAFGWGSWAFWFLDEDFESFGCCVRILSLLVFEWGFWAFWLLGETFEHFSFWGTLQTPWDLLAAFSQDGWLKFTLPPSQWGSRPPLRKWNLNPGSHETREPGYS